MAVKSVRLSVGSIFPKGPGKIYFYRYQVDGHLADKKTWDLASPAMDNAMLASATTGNVEVLKLLIAHGGEINCVNDKDETPLIIAKNKGHVEYVRYIVSLGETDPLLKIKKSKEHIKAKREKLKAQKRKDFFHQHRVRHTAEIKKLRQAFFNRRPDQPSRAAMDLLMNKRYKIIWYNNNYPQHMEAVNLRLSSTPEKNKFYGTVDTVLAVEDLYPAPQDLYKKLKIRFERNNFYPPNSEECIGILLLVNTVCTVWEEPYEMDKVREELKKYGEAAGLLGLMMPTVVEELAKTLETAHSSKKTFRITVKIEKGSNGMEYISIQSLDPYVGIIEGKLP